MYLFGRLSGGHAIEVVPGVVADGLRRGLGSPLSAKNDVLSVIPGPLDADTMAQRLAEADAAAIIKVGRHLEKIRSVLAQMSLSDNARYIERATMAEQRIVPLADVDDGDAPCFSMILVHKRAEAWK